MVPLSLTSMSFASNCVTATGVKAADRGYVALHGTGTPLGDPIEMGALGQALASSSKTETTHPQLAVGSVKSCYGHSEGAAGLTGTLLAIQTLQQKVSLSLHIQRILCFEGVRMEPVMEKR